eukprot:m.45777 g.45777  ORF g.45777 m.45777 type:complete len:64 (+) comp7235_c3_seq1:296-487(+)
MREGKKQSRDSSRPLLPFLSGLFVTVDFVLNLLVDNETALSANPNAMPWAKNWEERHASTKPL